ncbi:hypothetical protein ACP4OV_017274 [Aristida adscensionis]
MFSAARCFVPLHGQPRVAVRWPCRRAPPPVAGKVSAKARRGGSSSRGPRRDSPWDADAGGSDADDRIDDAFFGQEPDDDGGGGDEPPPERSASPAPAGPQLRGSDVLHALQRAVAAKEAKKKRNRTPAARRQGTAKLKGGGGGGAVVAGEVRPVVVRPEWAARIRELELRVQQLAQAEQ